MQPGMNERYSSDTLMKKALGSRERCGMIGEVKKIDRPQFTSLRSVLLNHC